MMASYQPKSLIFLTLIVLGITLVQCTSEPEQYPDAGIPIPDQVDFNFHVRPILSDRCYACHGPDENAVKGDFRLDTEEHAFKALKSEKGFAIIAGDPEKSEIMHRIYSTDPDYIMPPPESEMSLTENEKLIIKKWIKQGAEWKDHWAFIPPKIDNPIPKELEWGHNGIDYFIYKKIQEVGLSHAEEASKIQWLRRVTFDITGLPPEATEIEAFLADDASDAFQRVVDRLLASPAFGERMASIWLDIARYADSHGYQDDRPRTMWPWRDWVIDAFNNNLPYDQFATWQIAGDLLPNATYEQQLATGFNRNHAITQEGGVVEEEYLNEYAADRTQTFSTAFLGITMECARCHTHKYDPFTQEEYYQLLGFFNNIGERGQINYFDEAPTPNMDIIDPQLDSQMVAVKQWILKMEQELIAIENKPTEAFQAWENQFRTEQLDPLRAKGQIAHFKLDNSVNGIFTSQIKGQPKGKMNINLDPSIQLPEIVEGWQGKGLTFHGLNFLSLGEIGDFEWYDDFSLGGWIKHSNSHEKKAGIFSRRNGEQKRGGYDVILTPENKVSARLIHHYVPKANINYAIEVQTVNSIPTNQWQHLFITYDGSGQAAGLQIYLNGKPQLTQVVMDSLRQMSILNGNDFLVGNWNHRARNLTDLYGFKGGSVDEVQLYSRQLSPIEVQFLAQNEAPIPREAFVNHYLLHENKNYHKVLMQLDSLRRIDLEKPQVMVMQELDTIKATYLLNRGAYDDPIKQVYRGTPKAVLAFNANKYPSNRLGLTQWLFDEENPLTSRVIVNRFWQIFFGQGIVATPEDFGNQGSLPTHPELLDWLAVTFQEGDWNMKALVKLIVLSATYRQDASITPQKLKQDKANLWLARGPSQRLTAEMLRDQAICASGLYNDKVGGKWVKPYQPAGVWKELANQIGENKYRPSQGKDLFRRSLYNYWKRTIPPPNLLTFDAPDRVVCSVKRQQTSTPLQSLILLNDPIFVEASKKLSEYAFYKNTSIENSIKEAFTQVVSRPPKPKELELLNQLYLDELDRFKASSVEAQALLQVGNTEVKIHDNAPELAALTVVTNTIFNLDEAKYK